MKLCSAPVLNSAAGGHRLTCISQSRLRTANVKLHRQQTRQNSSAHLGRLFNLSAVSIDHRNELFKISVGSDQTEPNTVQPWWCHSYTVHSTTWRCHSYTVHSTTSYTVHSTTWRCHSYTVHSTTWQCHSYTVHSTTWWCHSYTVHSTTWRCHSYTVHSTTRRCHSYTVHSTTWRCHSTQYTVQLSVLIKQGMRQTSVIAWVWQQSSPVRYLLNLHTRKSC